MKRRRSFRLQLDRVRSHRITQNYDTAENFRGLHKDNYKTIQARLLGVEK